MTLFLLTVFGLLLGAGIKNRMEKSGFSPNWSTGTPRWWEVSGSYCVCPAMIPQLMDSSRTGFQVVKLTGLVMTLPTLLLHALETIMLWRKIRMGQLRLRYGSNDSNSTQSKYVYKCVRAHVSCTTSYINRTAFRDHENEATYEAK